ncbi:MAG: VCBS repeat-containing protein [Planctomycetota bacterium]
MPAQTLWMVPALLGALATSCNDSSDDDQKKPPPLRPDLVVQSLDVAGLQVVPLTLVTSGSVVARVVNATPEPLPPGVDVVVVAFHDANLDGVLDAGDAELGRTTFSSDDKLGLDVSIDVTGDALFRDARVLAVVDATNVIDEGANEGNNVFDPSGDCVYDPSTANFNPVVQWEWMAPTVLPAFDTVHSTPAVGDLDGDGIPEIVFPSSNNGGNFPTGPLRALRGTDGTEFFTVDQLSLRAHCSVAIGDLDGDGSPEIVASNAIAETLYIFEHDGALRLETDPIGVSINWGGIAIADLFGDGLPEIVVGSVVLAGDGTVLSSGTGAQGTNAGALGPISVISDIDLDGSPEIIAGATVYTRFSLPHPDWSASGEGYSAVANFDADPEAEVVVVNSGQVRLYDTDGTFHPMWNGGNSVSIPAGGAGGAPTIADFDSDGEPEVGVAGAFRYAVFDTDGSLLWSSPTNDSSSGVTGSSLFDFNGDGAAEVIYGDQDFLFVYRGAPANDGDQVIFQSAKTSGTWCEYPLVADVDADGAAEIVDIRNGAQRGIRVFTDPAERWVATRRVWNQHTYHITNVGDDLSIPVVEAPNWLTPSGEPFNSFRQNTLADAMPSLAADFTASLIRSAGPESVTVRIGNAGSTPASSVIEVALYNQDPASSDGAIATATVDASTLPPGTFRDVTIDVGGPVPSEVWIVVDDNGAGVGIEVECAEENNLVLGVPQ